ncbi:MAG: phosphatase PAP2 family protein [Caldilineaceae bacterium]|nr:phosphatase PAP2 family protein [Caldilineaceae bacterium]
MASWLQALRWRLHHIDAALSFRLARSTDDSSERSLKDGLALVGAHLGDSWLWVIVAALLLRKSQRGRGQDDGRGQRRVIGWLLSFAAAIVLTLVVKQTVQRQRPGAGILLYGAGADVHSFPSGHAARMGATAVWATALWPTWGWLLWPLTFWICWSRVRLGVHYVGDMLAGLLLGGLVGATVRYGIVKR